MTSNDLIQIHFFSSTFFTDSFFMLLKLPIEFFISVIILVFFRSRISVLFFFIVYVSEQILWFMYYFSDFVELSVFYCSLLGFLEIIIFNYLLGNSETYISLGSVTRALLVFFRGVMFV